MTSLQSLLTDEKLCLLRHKLSVFFARRGCANPLDLAEETISIANLAIHKATLKGEEITVNLADAEEDGNQQDNSTGSGIDKELGDISKFFFGVARNILRQYYRKLNRNKIELSIEQEMESGHDFGYIKPDDAGQQIQELGIECLRKCLQTISPSDCEMVLRFYGEGEEDNKEKQSLQRKRLARELGLSDKALNSLVLRRRRKLEKCVAECLRNS